MSDVIVLVNGTPESAMGSRAKELFSESDAEFYFRTESKFESLKDFVSQLRRFKGRTVYVMDLAWSGVMAAIVSRLGRRDLRYILDTGDAVFEIAKSMGRSVPGLAASWGLEQTSLRSFDHLVVRGHGHLDLLKRYKISKPATVIPDGVDMELFNPAKGSAGLRKELSINESSLVVGIVGSSIWNSRLGICYGWDLVGAFGHMRKRDIVGVMIGGGDGIEKLKVKAKHLNALEQLRFVDRVPLEKLPNYINLLDVCLSTQTNDWVGRVRTTGKLPLYLACDRFVLASKVGEAERILDPEMLVPYEGVVDVNYPRALAQRILGLSDRRESLSLQGANRRKAEERFDYRHLRVRLKELLA